MRSNQIRSDSYDLSEQHKTQYSTWRLRI